MKEDRETRQIQGKGQEEGRRQRETTPYYEISTSEGQEKGKDEDDDE